MNSYHKFFVLFTWLNISALGLASTAQAQTLKTTGTCEVEISGPKNITYAVEVTGKEETRSKNAITTQNHLWGKRIVEEFRAISPSMGDMMARSQLNPRVPIILGCKADKHMLTIADFDGKVAIEDFTGKTGTWPLVGNSSSLHKEGTITGSFLSSDAVSIMSLTPSEAGELTITKFTDTDFEASFQFKREEYTVKGTFDLELKSVK